MSDQLNPTQTTYRALCCEGRCTPSAHLVVIKGLSYEIMIYNNLDNHKGLSSLVAILNH